MLTGTRAFDGEDVTDVIASVVKSEPSWKLLPETTPPNLRFLLERCLEKDAKRRLQDIGDYRILLDAPPAPVGPPIIERARPRAVAMAATGAAFLAATVTGLAFWGLRPEPPRPVKRFAITLPDGVQFSMPPFWHLVALSPDGTHLVYAANQRLYLKRMDRLEAEPIRGTEGGLADHARSPFFSPDGEWIGFWQGGQIKKVAITGGAPVMLCEAQTPLGTSWGPDDTILFGQDDGIWQVAATGGRASKLIALDAAKVESACCPQMLPGGEAILFALRSQATTYWDDARIVVQMLDTGERRVVVEGGTDGRYLATGHLVYAREGVLLAIPFDVGRFVVSGGPVPVVDGVRAASAFGGITAGGGPGGAAHFAVSRHGSLAYVPGGLGTVARTLV
jgi:serine/threonine-protein kinase